MSRVLLIGLPKQDEENFKRHFSSVDVKTEILPTLDSAFEKIPGDPPSLIVTESTETLEPLRALNDVLKTNAPATPFLVVTSNKNSHAALSVMRAGAFDCVARPYNRFQVLAAAKRAAMRSGRTLFTEKVAPRKNPLVPILIAISILFLGSYTSKRLFEGPPPMIMSLGSAHLGGIQWEGRALWVSDWFESTVTRYEAKKGFSSSARDLVTTVIYRMQDSQPILACNTPSALITIAADLKMRIHQRSVGLPTLQAVAAPGTNPTGLAWDGKNIWSCDANTNLLYRHSADLVVLDSVKSILKQPQGLAYDGTSLWVVGGSPLKLARLEQNGDNIIWRGPYPIARIMPDGVTPSGVAIGFNRLWYVSGGDPRIMSAPLSDLTREIKIVKKVEKKEAKKDGTGK